ncbi:MAG: hypothetical protein WKF41_13730 [Gaiellaceae bacterium]
MALLVGVGAALLAGSGSSAAEITDECAAASVRASVSRFVGAYNIGDSPRLDSLFAHAPDFKWYSAGPPGLRIQSAAYRRDTLLSYFRARHRQDDRLRLLSFKFQGHSNGLGHFQYKFERRARDYRAGKPFKVVGKGAAVCADKEEFMADKVRFVVMSLGNPEPR